MAEAQHVLAEWLAVQRRILGVSADNDPPFGRATLSMLEDCAVLVGRLKPFIQTPKAGADWARAVAEGVEVLRAEQKTGSDRPRNDSVSEGDERGQAFLDKYTRAARDYAALLGAAHGDALNRFQEALAEAGPDAMADGLKPLYRLWVDCAEAAYQVIAHDRRFAVAWAGQINSLLALGGQGQGINGSWAERLDTRTRCELESIQEGLGELRRRLSGADTPPGALAREAVYREDAMVLYRYRSRVERPAQVPLLLVYALVNRPDVLDLREDRSTIRGLLDQGIDVYLIDWGYPGAADQRLTLDDYINGYIRRCVDHIRKAHGLDAINLLGICQGGVFSLCYAAMHPASVRNLITMVTPVDFATEGDLLALWARELDVDLMVDTLGNVPGGLLNLVFLSMQPFRLGTGKYLDVIDRLDDPEALACFMRMEQWIFDSPDQAGVAFRQFIKWFYQQNRLVRGDLRIGDREVRLADITMPVLNVYASADHIAPPAASMALRGKTTASDYSELAFDGGHIGIYVSARAQREVPPAIAAWLKDRS